jgi:hypothetical protein
MVVRALAVLVVSVLLGAVVACSDVVYLGHASAPTGFRPGTAVAANQPQRPATPPAPPTVEQAEEQSPAGSEVDAAARQHPAVPEPSSPEPASPQPASPGPASPRSASLQPAAPPGAAGLPTAQKPVWGQVAKPQEPKLPNGIVPNAVPQKAVLQNAMPPGDPSRPDFNRTYTLIEAERALDDARARSRVRPYRDLVNMWYVFLSDPVFTKSASYREHREKLAAMAKDSPQLATPLISMAQAHLLEAWRERGYGPEDGISPEIRQRWKESAGEARKLLEQAVQKGVKDVEAHASLLEVARIEGWPLAEARKVFEQGRKVDNRDVGLYTAMAEYLLPRWRGQPGDLEKFAAEVPKMVPGEDGLDAYMHVAYTVNQYDSNLLFWGSFDRSLLAKGAVVTAMRYPETRNLVPFAALCTVAAQDVGSARRIREAVKHNDAPRVDLWQFVSEDFFEWCDQSGIGRAQWIWGAPLNYPAVAFSRDSKAVWCATGLGATAVARWQPGTKEADVIWPVGGHRIEGLVVDRERNWVAAIVGGERRTGWLLWSADKPEASPIAFATPDTCRAIAIHPKSPEVAFAVGRTVRTMNVSSKTEGKPLEMSEPADALKFSADGRWLAVSGGTFSVWDVERREKRFELPNAQGPNRTEIACEKIVDLDDQGRIWAIAFAPGSHPVKRSLVRYAADGKTWETLIADLHTLGPVQPSSAVVSPDQRQLAILSQEKSANEMESIRVWNIAEGTAKRLCGNKEHVGSMAFSPDGTKLASVSQGGGPLKIWELPQVNQQAQANGK